MDSGQLTRVLTLDSSLPMALMDRILTVTEEALVELGATRIWLERSTPGMSVMAEIPSEHLTRDLGQLLD